MASSPLCYVSSHELSNLADRLGKIESSRLAELLGLDDWQEYVTSATMGESDDQASYKLLTAWRDKQEIGSDIRGCLAEKLQCFLPGVSNLLLSDVQECGEQNLMYYPFKKIILNSEKINKMLPDVNACTKTRSSLSFHGEGVRDRKADKQ